MADDEANRARLDAIQEQERSEKAGRDRERSLAATKKQNDEAEAYNKAIRERREREG